MMMKKLIGMIVVGTVVLLAGCNGDKAQMLQQFIRFLEIISKITKIRN